VLPTYTTIINLENGNLKKEDWLLQLPAAQSRCAERVVAISKQPKSVFIARH
jgi:hypothetical protein